jgi:hypothetical protein
MHSAAQQALVSAITPKRGITPTILFLLVRRDGTVSQHPAFGASAYDVNASGALTTILGDAPDVCILDYQDNENPPFEHAELHACGWWREVSAHMPFRVGDSLWTLHDRRPRRYTPPSVYDNTPFPAGGPATRLTRLYAWNGKGAPTTHEHWPLFRGVDGLLWSPPNSDTLVEELAYVRLDEPLKVDPNHPQTRTAHREGEDARRYVLVAPGESVVVHLPSGAVKRLTYERPGFWGVEDVGGACGGQAADSAGVKYDADKPRPELLPPAALLQVAEVLAYGARKYPSADNWRKLEALRARYTGAALRHVLAYMGGETHDAESGHHHLAHAATCLLFILQADHEGLDNE